MHPAFVILAAVWLLASPCPAELPPSVYEQRQKSAPEHLTIEVQRVDIEPGEASGEQKVHLVAKVVAVHRSATELAPGSLITITYSVVRRPRDYVGPGEVPILEEHTETVAFLAKDPESSDYHPAAGVMSFSEF